MVMASTIQEVLRPFFVMCFIIGIGVYPMKQPKPEIRRTIYLSILYSLTIWFAYGYFLYNTLNIFTLKKLYRSTFTIAVFIINIVITITSMIMTFFYQKRLEMCMMKLTVVDDTLEKLGTSKMYQKMHILSKRVLVGWIIYCFATNIYDMKWWIQKKEISSWGLVLPFILNHCPHSNTFVELLFIFILWHIGIRFDKVNEHVRCLLVKKDHQFRCAWKKPVVTFLHQYVWNYKQTLWASMHLHLELCRIARELNLIFGMQTTIETVSYLLIITALCYYLCLIWIHQIKVSIYNMSQLIVWILIYFVRFCAINLMCENVCIKANKISMVVHQLTNIIRYADISEEICQFALQAAQHPLKFNGIGFFFLGNVFIQKFCMAVLTFVIITAQMNMYVSNLE
ncbi:putative gustatory receptor 28b [Linepithema humile]|uniref:putative gustatory receptor 28b n=1 Tax=Linepithema humile TaxID=83485 RepID=UPI00351E3398